MGANANKYDTKVIYQITLSWNTCTKGVVCEWTLLIGLQNCICKRFPVYTKLKEQEIDEYPLVNESKWHLTRLLIMSKYA